MSSNMHVSAPPPDSVRFPAAYLLEWYGVHRRELPWRRTKIPYRIWLSEVMLQQTQVATVIPYYERFLECFPTVFDLARASEQDVLKAWENLGYYTRARQLHRTAKIVAGKYGGQFPKQWEDLITLPGIGAYTAGAILSIAFGQTVPAIDGNVRRVLCRFFALQDIFPDKNGSRCLTDILEPLIPAQCPGEFNQAVMELGATVCLPRCPRCSDCPLGNHCLAFRYAAPEEFPVRQPKKAIPVRHAVAAIINDGRGRILLVKRASGGLLGGLWKFPGGFCEREEEPVDALRRTLQEEVGGNLCSETYMGLVRHAYTHFRLRLQVFTCEVVHDPRTLIQGPDSRWMPPVEIRTLPLSKADRLAAALAGLC